MKVETEKFEAAIVHLMDKHVSRPKDEASEDMAWETYHFTDRLKNWLILAGVDFT